MVCKKCGKEFEGTFCPYCGEKAGEGLPSECPVCGNPRKEDEIFCSKCGYSYVARNQSEQETHPRSGIKLDIFSGEKAAKVFAGIGKAWWLVEGVGTLLLGVLVLLSLSAPIMLHMGYDVSANGFVNAFTINVDGGFTAICVVLLAIAIFLILGGSYRFFRAWEFPYGEVSSLKSWLVDGVVVAALVVLGSIGVGKAGEWLGSPGAGLSFCVVLGVFGIIFFVFRILFETKYIDIEQKEAVGAKVKQSKLSAKSGKIAFNIKNAIILLMTIAIIATVIAVPVKFISRNPLNKSAYEGFRPYYTSKSSITGMFGFSEDDGENRTSITFYSPEYANMERMIDRLNEVSGEDLFGDFDEDMSEDDLFDSLEGMMGVSELVEQMEEKRSKMQYQFTTVTFTALNYDQDTSDLVFESAIHNASAGYQDEEEDAPTRELIELTVRENVSSHSSYGKRYTNQAVVYYDAEFSDGSFVVNGKATAYTADGEVFNDYENAKTVTWSDDLYDEYSYEIDKIKDEDSIPATRYWYYNTVTDQLVLTGGDTGIIAEKLTGDWSSYLRAVRGIVIDGDVSISDNAFEGLSNLSSVTFNDGGSIFHVGKDAFVGTAYWNDIDNWQDGQLYVGDWLVGLRNVPGGEFEIDEDLKYAEGFLAKATGVTTLILHTADYDTISDMLGYQGSNSEVKRFELFPRSVKNIVIADGVEEIDSMAFSGFDKITSVTIPDSVTSIGREAFSGCSGLTSVTIPDSVTSIGREAFSGCSGLTSITIPFVGEKADGTGVTDFGYIFYVIDLFDDVYNIPESLKEVIITGGESIGDWAFAGYNGLTSVTIENGVTSIGNRAFSGCSGLTSVTIGDGVTSIGEDVFYGCSGLTSITIPDSVTSIGHAAFYGCSGLTSVVIPDSVTSIGNSAFSGCSGLTSITIPFVGEKADGTGQTSFDYIFGYYVPESLEEVIITGGESIGDGAFSGYNSLTSVTIEDGVTSIGDGAFEGCSGLTSVTIGDSVTSIGAEAFYDCSGLTSIVIPDSVTSIGNYAFSGCSGLTSIVILDSVTSIGSSAFSGCSSLQFNEHGGAKYLGNEVNPYVVLYDVTDTSVTSFEIMAQTKIIYDGAFSGCSDLTSVTIPDSVTSIGYQAFYRCSNLTDVYYQGDLSGWSEIEFADAYANPKCRADNLYINGELLQNDVVIPEGTEKIGACAFYNFSNLTSIVIPDSVTGIGYGAFAGCSGLTSITIPFVGEGVDGTVATHFGYIFGASEYYENGDCVPGLLKEVIFTGGESIADNAFEGCTSLTTITIPGTVTELGDDVFAGCPSLGKIIFQGTIEQWKALELSSSGNDKLVIECSDGRYKFFVTYDLDGGVNAASNPSGYTVLTLGGADGSIALADPTKLYDSNGDGSFEVAPDGYTFLGWYKDPSFEQKVTSLTLDLGDVTLYAKWGEPVSQTSTVQVYTREGDYIYFGEYPQTIKADDVTVGDVADKDGYYLGSDGERYAKVVADPYESGYTFSDGSDVTYGETYYFKVEPIRWRILSESDGSAFIMADQILINRQYHDTTSTTVIDGETIYANNYMYSDIRAWLNDEFFNSVFGELSQEIIKVTAVDNSASSTSSSSNSYACGDTFDKVFLLSYDEVTNDEYFAGQYERVVETSDYALANGAWVNNREFFYWLRSPSADNSSQVCDVTLEKVQASGFGNVNNAVTKTGGGVVPAMNITL